MDSHVLVALLTAGGTVAAAFGVQWLRHRSDAPVRSVNVTAGYVKVTAELFAELTKVRAQLNAAEEKLAEVEREKRSCEQSLLNVRAQLAIVEAAVSEVRKGTDGS